MNEYIFELAGVVTALHTPDKITISENLRPFLCGSYKKPDCTIRVQSCAVLPEFSGRGVWHGPAYYDCKDSTASVFHCIAPQGEAYALTEFFENGDIQISALPEYLSYFSGSEGIFNRIGLETMLLQYQGLLLHASLIKYENIALAFAGASGVGKSTQADFWNRCLNAEILNGDRSALRKKPEGWVAYGCPYAGTSGIYKNDSAPLKAIILLQQGEENHLRALSPKEAFPYIYPELSIHRWDKHFVAAATDLCLEMLSDIPVYLLECCRSESAVWFLKEGLKL